MNAAAEAAKGRQVILPVQARAARPHVASRKGSLRFVGLPFSFAPKKRTMSAMSETST